MALQHTCSFLDNRFGQKDEATMIGHILISAATLMVGAGKKQLAPKWGVWVWSCQN